MNQPFEGKAGIRGNAHVQEVPESNLSLPNNTTVSQMRGTVSPVLLISESVLPPAIRTLPRDCIA
jgi:hypothetical protein